MINDELERIWKEAVVASFKALSWHLPGCTKEVSISGYIQGINISVYSYLDGRYKMPLTSLNFCVGAVDWRGSIYKKQCKSSTQLSCMGKGESSCCSSFLIPATM
jgi:hypothetical protein